MNVGFGVWARPGPPRHCSSSLGEPVVSVSYPSSHGATGAAGCSYSSPYSDKYSSEATVDTELTESSSLSPPSSAVSVALLETAEVSPAEEEQEEDEEESESDSQASELQEESVSNKNQNADQMNQSE